MNAKILLFPIIIVSLLLAGFVSAYGYWYLDVNNNNLVPTYDTWGADIERLTVTGTSTLATTTITDLTISSAFNLGGIVGSGGIDFNNQPGWNASYLSGGYLYASSTTATSTFLGGILVSGLSSLSTTTIVGTTGITGALTATSYGGITEANLLDKTATGLFSKDGSKTRSHEQ